MGSVVYVKDSDGLKRGWGRTWSWQTFWMGCRHTVLSMQMAEVRWMVYWVIVLVGGGSDVMMACWNALRPSKSLSSLQALRTLASLSLTAYVINEDINTMKPCDTMINLPAGNFNIDDLVVYMKKRFSPGIVSSYS